MRSAKSQKKPSHSQSDSSGGLSNETSQSPRCKGTRPLFCQLHKGRVQSHSRYAAWTFMNRCRELQPECPGVWKDKTCSSHKQLLPSDHECDWYNETYFYLSLVCRGTFSHFNSSIIENKTECHYNLLFYSDNLNDILNSYFWFLSEEEGSIVRSPILEPALNFHF